MSRPATGSCSGGMIYASALRSVQQWLCFHRTGVANLSGLDKGGFCVNSGDGKCKGFTVRKSEESCVSGRRKKP